MCQNNVWICLYILTYILYRHMISSLSLSLFPLTCWNPKPGNHSTQPPGLSLPGTPNPFLLDLSRFPQPKTFPIRFLPIQTFSSPMGLTATSARERHTGPLHQLATRGFTLFQPSSPLKEISGNIMESS